MSLTTARFADNWQPGRRLDMVSGVDQLTPANELEKMALDDAKANGWAGYGEFKKKVEAFEAAAAQGIGVSGMEPHQVGLYAQAMRSLQERLGQTVDVIGQNNQIFDREVARRNFQEEFIFHSLNQSLGSIQFLGLTDPASYRSVYQRGMSAIENGDHAPDLFKRSFKAVHGGWISRRMQDGPGDDPYREVDWSLQSRLRRNVDFRNESAPGGFRAQGSWEAFDVASSILPELMAGTPYAPRLQELRDWAQGTLLPAERAGEAAYKETYTGTLGSLKQSYVDDFMISAWESHEAVRKEFGTKESYAAYLHEHYDDHFDKREAHHAAQGAYWSTRGNFDVFRFAREARETAEPRLISAGTPAVHSPDYIAGLPSAWFLNEQQTPATNLDGALTPEDRIVRGQSYGTRDRPQTPGNAATVRVWNEDENEFAQAQSVRRTGDAQHLRYLLGNMERGLFA